MRCFLGSSILLCLSVVSLSANGQNSLDELVARGEELFHADIGCRVCHADTGEGLVGPTLSVSYTHLTLPTTPYV